MEQINARSIFSPATGFIRRGGFDWSCNPYVGCTFGCTYCYAMFLPQNRRPKEDWGRWLIAKRNAVELAGRRAAKLAGRAVYLSSVTDPYLPAERSQFLTRGILEALAPHQPRLLVPTRGPPPPRAARAPPPPAPPPPGPPRLPGAPVSGPPPPGGGGVGGVADPKPPP